ncbi:MAG: hypothetical protein EPO68_03160 [Planctomycetota bacterium]|nr:MAG: hypothetical protein EPO68_03160 [Planctomycetota bacterium]
MKLVAIALRGLCVGVLCWSAVGCATPPGHRKTELEAGPTGIRLSSESAPKEKTLKVQLPPGACACITQYDAGGQQVGSPSNLASPGGSVPLSASARTATIQPYKCDDATARNPCTAPGGTSGVGGPTTQSLERRAVWIHALPDEAGRAQWLSVIASGADAVVASQLLELVQNGPVAACPPNLDVEFWASASPHGLELYETEPLLDLPVALNAHAIDLATSYDGCWFRSTCAFPIEHLDISVPGINALVIPYEPVGKPRVEYRIEHEVE